MQVRGKTGVYINSLRLNALKSCAFWALMLAMSALLVIVVNPIKNQDTTSLLLSTAGIIASVVFFKKAEKDYVAYSRATIGLKSEKRVVNALKKSGVDIVYHSAIISKAGDADHVVLGPVCAVIETKTGSGFVKISNGCVIAGRRRIPKDPIKQAKIQATHLGKMSNVYVDAIVCVVDMTNDPFKYNGVWVCSLKDLNNVIASLPRVLSPRAAERVADLLKSE